MQGHEHNGHHEQSGREQTRNDAGGKQFADVRLGHDAVNHHDGGGWDHDAQSAPCGNDAGGQRVAVAQFFHGRIRHLAHGGRRGDG